MEMQLRSMTPDDRHEVAELIYSSINVWYQRHGRPEFFHGGPHVTEVFFDVYQDLDPGCDVIAVNPRSGRIMGSCFYHPREHHVSLGIMTVHPNYFGQGVGRALLKHIIDFTEQNGHDALRLTQSSINIDSFSLYNKAGCVPRYAYQDMMTQVPPEGMSQSVDGEDRVRDATLADLAAMAELEMEVSGITREPDYRYCIENKRSLWHVSVIEDSRGAVGGFMISCGHTAMNMLGPGVARTEADAAALILRELDRYRGRSPVCLIPMDKQQLVRQMYQWGARNCEMHFCQVYGKFKPFAGVNMPTFLPETA